MRVLLVKTSSLGDVIHNLPVVSDLCRALPEATIDWCVEESFAEIPRLHPAVRKVIPVAVRRWRKHLTDMATWREMRAFRRTLQDTAYDAILDTQGLLKSGLITRLARGKRYGYAAEVAREPLAARCYDTTFVIPPNAHAVERNRWLSAAAFDYPVDLPLDYGIRAPDLALPWLSAASGRYAVLLTATSRDDKLWDEANWTAVARALRQHGITPVFPSGSASERQRAERIAADAPGSVVAPTLRLTELAALLGRAQLAIGVDTGLAHLATALSTPTVALYVSTDPALTGIHGRGFVRNLGASGRAPRLQDVLNAAEPVLQP